MGKGGGGDARYLKAGGSPIKNDRGTREWGWSAATHHPTPPLLPRSAGVGEESLPCRPVLEFYCINIYVIGKLVGAAIRMNV